ncbi:MAG: zinc ribbon domain-containing protein [Lachnospiraceae bacterium]|nr:zinc ribbon domain-containing protein [Lachnospiraceae bacterium]
MKVKCDFCGQMIDEGQATCPNCGGVMPTANRVASDQPKTIEELKRWYTDHNLPPEEKTRFFIGKDIKAPKAFGIYQASDGNFVVYKNKSDGERVVRYKGVDEGYAVNELYQRLRSEIVNQKANIANNGNNRATKKSGKLTIGDIFLTIIALIFFSPLTQGVLLIVIALIFTMFDHSPSNGYYRYNGNDYYYQGSSWYSYDTAGDSWSYASNSDELDSIINDDTDDDYRYTDHQGSLFEDSTWYNTGSSYSSSDSYDSYDWDSGSSWGDSSWDSGSSWDSSYTDWDSGW